MKKINISEMISNKFIVPSGSRKKSVREKGIENTQWCISIADISHIDRSGRGICPKESRWKGEDKCIVCRTLPAKQFIKR